MRLIYDQDEYETVVTSRQCTTCNGDRAKCNGGCNGMTSLGSKRRTPDAIAAIKAARLRKEEDEILAKADAIRARRPR